MLGWFVFFLLAILLSKSCFSTFSTDEDDGVGDGGDEVSIYCLARTLVVPDV